MPQNVKFLGIIPARGGSKGIPQKCITQLKNKPLIAYTIEEAKKSNYLDKLIVSTDDKNIADISKKYGAEIPFIRPERLAKDDTPSLPVIQHALEFFKKKGYLPEYVVILQPTSPLRRTSHIDSAIKKIIDTQADMVVSLCKVTQHPFWMRRLEKYDKVVPFIETRKVYYRRQDLPELYRLNGAITIAKSKVIMEEKKKVDIRGYIMDELYSVDIDTYLDLLIAEKFLDVIEKETTI
jgi:N-acylneuraminate cytidylyltransferase/CMP-N,N'-diacetyllegionaminic acid synthase